MTDTIPDHVGREAVRLLNEQYHGSYYLWPRDIQCKAVITVAKLLMNPPAPMTDLDEEAAKRVFFSVLPAMVFAPHEIAIATDQMRKEREAWEAGR